MTTDVATGARTASPQRVAIAHARDAHFDAGLRAYAAYRDLGVRGATDGRAVAHVIRFKPPCTDEVRVWHTHDVEFQLIYVLKGWIVTELDGHGTNRLEAGSSWTQPPGIRHRVLDYSDDCEVLEIVLPAEFETVMAG